MDVLLFCCIGNAFQSPLLAALYNAEAEALGLPARAISAGLSNRTEMPPTAVYLLEAAKRAFADLPSVLPALRAHQPRPLKTLPFVQVRGVSYLYDPARKADHLAQDAKAIHAWLAPAPNTQVVRLAIKDAGYEAWEQEGRPELDSPAGQAVLEVYLREVVTLRALARSLLAAARSSEDAAAEPAPSAAVADPLVAAPVPVPVPMPLPPPPVAAPLPAPIPVRPPAPPAPRVPVVITRLPTPPFTQRVPAFAALTPATSSFASPPIPPVAPPEAGKAEPEKTEPEKPAPVRRIVQPRLPPEPAPAAEAPAKPKAPRKAKRAPEAAKPVAPIVERAVAPIVERAPILERAPIVERAVAPMFERAPIVERAPIAERKAPTVEPEATIDASELAEERSEKAPKAPKRTAVEPAELERAEALEDVRAWIRAALPVRRPALTRYGLWQRAEKHFGTWEDAVAAAGIPVSPEPIWMLPRDKELSLDILIEALPDPVVARLCDLSLPKVRGRRRANGAPDAARQIVRRIMATEQLGKVPDEVIAKQLGISVEEVASVREAEEIPAPA